MSFQKLFRILNLIDRHFNVVAPKRTHVSLEF